MFRIGNLRFCFSARWGYLALGLLLASGGWTAASAQANAGGRVHDLAGDGVGAKGQRHVCCHRVGSRAHGNGRQECQAAAHIIAFETEKAVSSRRNVYGISAVVAAHHPSDRVSIIA